MFAVVRAAEGKEKAERQLLLWWPSPSCDVTAGRQEEELTPISIAEQSHYPENKRQEVTVCCCSPSFTLICFPQYPEKEISSENASKTKIVP